MSGTTTNLELFKYNPNTDGDQTFNIDNALNNNFDKLDTVIGALANLTTEQKTSLVAAINEIITNLGEKSSIDLDNLSSIGQAIIDAKIEAEALTAQNGYIKFKLNGISNLILQWGQATWNKGLVSGRTTVNADNIILPISFTTKYSAILKTSSRYLNSFINYADSTNSYISWGVWNITESKYDFDKDSWIAIGY